MGGISDNGKREFTVGRPITTFEQAFGALSTIAPLLPHAMWKVALVHDGDRWTLDMTGDECPQTRTLLRMLKAVHHPELSGPYERQWHREVHLGISGRVLVRVAVQTHLVRRVAGR